MENRTSPSFYRFTHELAGKHFNRRMMGGEGIKRVLDKVSQVHCEHLTLVETLLCHLLLLPIAVVSCFTLCMYYTSALLVMAPRHTEDAIKCV